MNVGEQKKPFSMIVSSADRNKKLWKIFLNCAHFIVQMMPESQRSRKQHQKATDIEKHTYVSPHVQTIQFL